MARNYRPAASRSPVSLATFRQQMADYARAERLRELRAERHISREKVAAAIDVTTKSLYAWENGGAIRWPNAKRLAEFYGVDPNEIIEREGSVEAAEMRRIERKVDALLDHFGIEVEQLDDIVSDFESETGDDPNDANGSPTAGTPGGRGRRAA